MADDVLARATVAVSADLSAYDTAMGQLPDKAQDAIRKSVSAIKAEMAEVGKAIATATNFKDVQKLADYQGKLKESLDAVKRSAIDQAQALNPVSSAFRDTARSAEDAAKSGRNWGRAGLEVSRAAEDAQYGIAGVLNNIPSLIELLGGGAGLAGAVSLVAVGAKVLYDHWDDITALFGQEATKTQAEQMEELAKKTEKTADETARLLKYEQDRENLKAQRGPTAAASDQENRINKAINEAPELKVRQAIENIHGQAIGNSIDSRITERVEKARKTLGDSEKARDRLAADPNPSAAAIYGKADAEKFRQAAAVELGAALEAYNKAYDEGRNAIQGNLARDVEALKQFIKEAEKRRLLPQSAIDKLKEAARTPEDVKDEEQQAAYDRQASRIDAENRQRLAQRKREAENRRANIKNIVGQFFQVAVPGKAEEAQVGLNEAAKSERIDQAKGLSERLSPGILEQIARGKTVDVEALQTSITRGLKDAGVKEPERFSREAALSLRQDAEKRIQDRVARTGGTRQQAALAEYGENLERLKSEANKNRPSYGITDFDSFRRELQDNHLNSSSNQALIDEQKRLTEAVIAGTKTQEDLSKALRERRNLELK